MEYEISRGLQRQNLIISDIDHEPELEFREQMLVNNSVPGILKLSVSEEDGRRKYLYDIGNMDSLRNRYENGNVNCTGLSNLFYEILKCAEVCREYLLSETDLLLEPEAVFFDGESPYVAYVPGLNRALHQQLAALCEFMMNRVDYRDEQAVVLIYAFYMSVKEESCTLDKLFDLLDKKTVIQENTEANYSEMDFAGGDDNPGTKDDQRSDRQRYVEQAKTYDITLGTPKNCLRKPQEHADSHKVLKASKGLKLPAATNGHGKNLVRAIILCIVGIIIFWGVLYVLGKGITRKSLVVAGVSGIAVVCAVARFLPKKKGMEMPLPPEEEKTELLFGRTPSTTICTLASDERDSILVDHLPFYIGKDPVNMDYILSEPGVSRVHAKLDRSNQMFQLTDLNSTNGTFINGKRIEPQIPAIVRRGDEICFGHSRYFFN